MLAKKIKVAYPVLLVLVGLVISFIPGIGHISQYPGPAKSVALEKE